MPIKNSLFYQVNSLFKVQRPSVKLKMNYKATGAEDFATKLAKLQDLLFGEGINRMALTATKKILIPRAIERMYNPGVGDYETSAGVAAGSAMVQYLPLIAAALENAQLIGRGVAGFASESQLDTIKMAGFTRKSSTTAKGKNSDGSSELDSKHGGGSFSTSSPYNIAWRIAEFGTGRYAYPEKRLPGDASDMGTKVPAGGGDWYLNPKGKGLIIRGQEGAHFLFGERKTMESVRQDIDQVLYFIRDQVKNILR